MAPFFPESTLNSARIVMLRGIRVGNPPFYEELVQIGFDRGSLPDFDVMAAVTFMDTIVSHEPFTNELLFHELVHVVQYEKLGWRSSQANMSGAFWAPGPTRSSRWRGMRTNWLPDLRQPQRTRFRLRQRFRPGLMRAGSSLGSAAIPARAPLCLRTEAMRTITRTTRELTRSAAQLAISTR